MYIFRPSHITAIFFALVLHQGGVKAQTPTPPATPAVAPEAAPEKSTPLYISMGVADTKNGDSTIIARALFKRSLAQLLQDATKKHLFSKNFSDPDPTPENPNPRWWRYAVTPEFDLKGGGDDSFSSIVLKLSGHIFGFATESISGTELLGPRTKNVWTHVIPISLGVETDQNADSANTIFEIGYAPLYQRDQHIRDSFGFNPFVALYFQGGYKFKLSDDAEVTQTGGRADQSKEKLDDELLRIKLDIRYQTKIPVFNTENNALSLIAGAKAWYDIANGEFYDHQEVTVRWAMTDTQTIDFTYENGSGAPNFNQGQQISTRLTVKF